MTLPPEQEPGKGSKRKGSRSVSSLTPEQLQRKRANDREAQRNIRARTKQHIDNLEKELSELRKARVASGKQMDQRIMELTRENDYLVGKITMLQQQVESLHMELRMRNGPPQTPSSLPSRPQSFCPSAGYNPEPIFGTSYLPTPEPTEQWPTGIQMSTISASVSSPCSSAGPAEDYITRFIPTSMPVSLMGAPGISQGDLPSLPSLNSNVEFNEDVEQAPADHGYSPSTVPHTPSPYINQQQPWDIPPGDAPYYPPSQ